MEHGASTYANRGCRCDVCRAAHAAKSRAYRTSHPDRAVYEQSYYANNAEKWRGPPITCLACGREFQPWTGRSRKYCSLACTGKANTKNQADRLGRKLVRLPDHPLANKTGRVLAYRATLYNSIGPGEHPCHWCGHVVTWTVRTGRGISADELAVDHLDGDDHNDVLANLVPSCNRCNMLRGFIRGWEQRTGRSVATLL
jgi:hypothetical protein